MANSEDRRKRLRTHCCHDSAGQSHSARNAARRYLPSLFGVGLIALVAAVSTRAARADDAETFDFGPYRAAAEYCRSDVARPLALSLDQRILCFDGSLPADQSLALVKRLKSGGLFVAHSMGGDHALMMKVADHLRDINATVVIYGYCLFSCADYLVIASSKTVILRDALVAWRPFADKGECVGFAPARDEGPFRLEGGACGKSEEMFSQDFAPIDRLRRKFLRTRRASSTFDMPPESTKVRKLLRKIDLERAFKIGFVMWMWHPRYQPSSVKTKIIYEAYPESQEDVDALVERLRLAGWIIYDP
ncbi:hypothetical protein [Bradyrhizobium sp. STM 3843]|uniref:hypothetical protein n=1 Tax=Bradyrhizobium sp. STM 3843 TaxID=551947 RepID=UPI0007C5201B|nr:hypothetical protein [Bradyrhizobium sp. STM 3843]